MFKLSIEYLGCRWSEVVAQLLAELFRVHRWLNLGRWFCRPITSRWLRSGTSQPSCRRGTFLLLYDNNISLSLSLSFSWRVNMTVLYIFHISLHCSDSPEPHCWCLRINAICPAHWTPALSLTRSHSLPSCHTTAASWLPARAPARTCCPHSTGSLPISPRASSLPTDLCIFPFEWLFFIRNCCDKKWVFNCWWIMPLQIQFSWDMLLLVLLNWVFWFFNGEILICIFLYLIKREFCFQGFLWNFYAEVGRNKIY